MSDKKKEIPIFSNPIIDTHCHLDYLKEEDSYEIIKKCKRYNVVKIITISVSPKNLDIVIKKSNEYDNVYCSQGIHPHEAKFFTEEIIKKIKANSKNSKVVAIGEIGLDYYYNRSPKEIQIKAFEEQLQLAVELNLPVIIHSRDAEKDTISILKNFSNSLIKKGVIHSFTSKESLANFAINEKFYLGFNGIITFKNASNVQKAVNNTPIDSIIIETDSPFLTPAPYRGKENAPYYLPLVAEKIAELKNIPIEQVLRKIYKNSCNFFNL